MTRRIQRSNQQVETDQEQALTADHHACPECKNTISIPDKAVEIVCNECELVVSDSRIDRGPEWRAFFDKENR